jgi:predicted DCC family thiol-disulfide oxidoreductase YuxK
MKTLYVLYDGSCRLCCRAVRILISEPSYLTLKFAPSDSSIAERRFSQALDAGGRDQLIVVADTGEVYRGTSAWIMVLYALRRYRHLAIRLSRPTWRPLAAKVIQAITRNRQSLSSFFCLSPDAHILDALRSGAARDPSAPNETCPGGACERYGPDSPPGIHPLNAGPGGACAGPSVDTPLDQLIRARQSARADWPQPPAHPPTVPPV